MGAWPTIPFRQTGTWLSGGTPTRNEPTFWGGDVPWIGTKDLKGFDLRTSSEFVTQLGADTGSRVVDPGAVLFVTRGMSLAKEFRVGVAATRLAFNQDVKAIVPRPELNGRFLAWFLRSKEQYVLDQCDTATHGTKRLPLERVETMPVPLPPLSEQRRIAAILDEADALRGKRREALGLLDALLRSAFLEMFGDPVTNPRGWETVVVDRLADVQGGLQVTSKRADLPIEVPYLRVANVYRDRLDLEQIKTIRATQAEVDRLTLRAGDVLVVEGHGNPDELGRCAVWDHDGKFVHQNHLIRVRSNGARVRPAYLSAFINSDGGRLQMLRAGKTTSGLNTISTSNVKATRIVLPPLHLQRLWEDFVHERRLHASAVETHARHIESLFDSLLHRAFAGSL